MASITKQELIDASVDAQTLEDFINSGSSSIALRLGGTIPSLSNVISDLYTTVGYQVPVAYTSGLNVTESNFTVDEAGVIYAPKPSSLPIASTPVTFDPNDWYAIQTLAFFDTIPVTLNDITEISAAPIVDNAIVQLRGHRTKGVGGGFYYYDAGSSAAVDFGFVLDGLGGDNSLATADANVSVAGSGTGRLHLIDQSITNVLQFGCDPTSTSGTDCSNRLQAAIDATYAKSRGGLVYIPAGGYRMSGVASRNATKNVNFIGDGATRWRAANAGEWALIIREIANSYSPLIIEKIQFIGTAATFDRDGLLSFPAKVIVKDCVFENCGIGMCTNMAIYYSYENCEFSSNCLGACCTTRLNGNTIVIGDVGDAWYRSVELNPYSETGVSQPSTQFFDNCHWQSNQCAFYTDNPDNPYATAHNFTFVNGGAESNHVGFVFVGTGSRGTLPTYFENVWMEGAQDGARYINGIEYPKSTILYYGPGRLVLNNFRIGAGDTTEDSIFGLYDGAICIANNTPWYCNTVDIDPDCAVIGTGIGLDADTGTYTGRLEDVILCRLGGYQATVTQIPHRVESTAYGKSAQTTFTCTLAGGAVLNVVGQDFATYSEVMFSTTGSLPTGLSANTRYFVVNAGTNVLSVSATRTVTPISLSGGSGTLKIHRLQCLYSGTQFSGDQLLNYTGSTRTTVFGGVLNTPECLNIAVSALGEGVYIRGVKFIDDDLYLLTFAARSDTAMEVRVRSYDSGDLHFINQRVVDISTEWRTFGICGYSDGSTNDGKIAFTNNETGSKVWQMSAVQLLHFDSMQQCVSFQRSRSFVGY